MSKKHVDDYYTLLTADYKEMIEALKDLEEEANKGLVSSEMLDNMKKEVANMKINYDRITYIMYLFNKPNKREKRFSYERQNKKLLQNIPESATLQGVRNENKSILNKIKDSFK